MIVDGQPKYLFGSAGSSYSVQTYFYAKPRRIEALPSGAYYFDPTDRRLVLISGGACIDPEIYDFLINRPVFDSAAFSIFLAAQLDAIEPLYGDLSLSFVTIEAGLMTQLLEMAAPSYGMGLCQIGGSTPRSCASHSLSTPVTFFSTRSLEGSSRIRKRARAWGKTQPANGWRGRYERIRASSLPPRGGRSTLARGTGVAI